MISMFLAFRDMCNLPMPGMTEASFLHITDLSLVDPTYILPFVMALTMSGSLRTSSLMTGVQKISDKGQNMIATFMFLGIPLIYTFFHLIFRYPLPRDAARRFTDLLHLGQSIHDFLLLDIRERCS